MLRKCFFESVDQAYRIIDDNSMSVVVPYGVSGAELCKKAYECHTFSVAARRAIMRSAQRYSVSVAPWHLDAMRSDNLCELTESGLCVARPEAYDEHLGLLLKADSGTNALIV
jgi:hypothetical protein